ncbi:hypothetical protein, partial [Xanthomonas campestris]|uniref:hypothetical protein n=1 Tax=Xanthomonas campestris TaxID=339 RepID=UPI0039C1D5B5
MIITKKRFSKRAWGLFALVLVSLTAAAATITIRAGDAPYNQVAVAKDITVLSEYELRVAAAFGLTGAYRVIHGPMSAPRGTNVEIIYSNGSSETAAVACVGGTVCVVPIAYTQKHPDGTPVNSGGGG